MATAYETGKLDVLALLKIMSGISEISMSHFPHSTLFVRSHLQRKSIFLQLRMRSYAEHNRSGIFVRGSCSTSGL